MSPGHGRHERQTHPSPGSPVARLALALHPDSGALEEAEHHRSVHAQARRPYEWECA